MKELLQGFFDLFEKVKAKMDTLTDLSLTKYTELADILLAKHDELAAVVAKQSAGLAEASAAVASVQAAEGARAKAEESKAKEDALVKQCLSRILFNQSFGGSLANYCEERGWSGITVYVEDRYWVLADPVFVAFREKRKPLVKQWVADKDFVYSTGGSNCYSAFKANILSNQKLSLKDIIFILKPTTDTNLVNRLVQMGAMKENIFNLTTLLDQTLQYFLYEKPLLGIKAKYPNVQLVFNRCPWMQNNDLTENEKNIMTIPNFDGYLIKNELIKNKKLISSAWDDLGYSNEDIIEVLTGPPRYYNENGVFSLKDVKGKLVNVVNGYRVTTDVPEDAKRKIFIIGQCQTFGYGSGDNLTMQSWLQRMLNKAVPEDKFEVVNVGTFIWGQFDNFKNILANLPARNNDIIFLNSLLFYPVIVEGCQLDLKDCFKKPYPYGDVWIYGGHYGPHGQHMVADALFAFLQEHDYFRRDGSPPPQRYYYCTWWVWWGRIGA